jgi:hypothetical protein
VQTRVTTCALTNTKELTLATRTLDTAVANKSMTPSITLANRERRLAACRAANEAGCAAHCRRECTCPHTASGVAAGSRAKLKFKVEDVSHLTFATPTHTPLRAFVPLRSRFCCVAFSPNVSMSLATLRRGLLACLQAPRTPLQGQWWVEHVSDLESVKFHF